MTLTEEGKRWAERNAPASMVANVALQADGETTWPENFVQAAVQTANERGGEEALRYQQMVERQQTTREMWASYPDGNQGGEE